MVPDPGEDVQKNKYMNAYTGTHAKTHKLDNRENTHLYLYTNTYSHRVEILTKLPAIIKLVSFYGMTTIVGNLILFLHIY